MRFKLSRSAREFCACRQQREMATQQIYNSNQCPVCNMVLASRQSLRRHWNNWHQNCNKSVLEEHLRQLDTAGKAHICPTFGKAYSRSNILKEHQEKEHLQQGLKRAPRFQCPFTGCHVSTSFYFLKDLLQHCEACHYDQIGISKLKHNYMDNRFIYSEMQFANWEEFLSWKTAEEGRTNTFYKQVQVNIQFTDFTAVSLETHLYGVANKTTSDGPKPSR